MNILKCRVLIDAYFETTGGKWQHLLLKIFKLAHIIGIFILNMLFILKSNFSPTRKSVSILKNFLYKVNIFPKFGYHEIGSGLYYPLLITLNIIILRQTLSIFCCRSQIL